MRAVSVFGRASEPFRDAFWARLPRGACMTPPVMVLADQR
jgi:hypothetical protein